jgi:hypothetical protein
MKALFLDKLYILCTKHQTIGTYEAALSASTKNKHTFNREPTDFSRGLTDRLCGLVVRVLGYRSGGPGSIPVTTRKKKE